MISQTNLEYQYLFSRKSEVPIIDMWLSAVNPLHRRKGLQQKLISTV